MTLTSLQLQTALDAARTIQGLYPGGGIAPNIYSGETDTQGLAQNCGRYWRVSFPGTASREDMLTDIKVIKLSWRAGGYIHWGVRSAWLSVVKQVTDIVPAGAKVLFEGHSLGAGIAQAGAHDLKDHFNIIGVVTFGGLRTFNHKAAASYNADLGDKTLRFTNHGDPVPLLPLQLPIPRTGIYWQTDGGLHFNQEGRLEVGQSWLSTLPIVGKFIAALSGEPPVVSRFIKVSAHPIASYISRLEQLA